MKKIPSHISDFFYIVLIQGLNYLVPIFLIPFLVRTLGTADYGSASFAQAFAQYFTLIINFGFDLSAVRAYSSTKDEASRREVFYAVTGAKFLLFLVSLLVLAVTLCVSSELRDKAGILSIAFLVNLGFLLYPSWFFQAVGKMRVAVYLNAATKLLMAIAIVLLVQGPGDVLFYLTIFSVTQILLGIVSFVLVARTHQMRFRFSFPIIWSQIKGGSLVFLSSVVINLYTNTNVFLLGLLANDLATGYFSGASKLVYGAVYLIFVPFSLIIYPKIGAAMANSYEAGIGLLRKAAWIALIMGAGMTLFLFLFSAPIIDIVFGNGFERSLSNFRILSFLPLLLALSNIFVVQGMLNLKMDRQFLVLTTIAAVFCLSFNFLMIPLYQDLAASYALVLTEAFITIAGYVLMRRKISVIFDWAELQQFFISIRHFQTKAGNWGKTL